MIDPDDPPRTWTLEEARAALPRVADIVERARRAAEGIQRRRETAGKAATGNGHVRGGGELPALHDAVADLETEGIVLRDVERGLVDFPAKAPSGRGYWLCWLVGEVDIEWWHWPEDGFAGRTPLSEPPG